MLQYAEMSCLANLQYNIDWQLVKGINVVRTVDIILEQAPGQSAAALNAALQVARPLPSCRRSSGCKRDP